MGMVSYTDQITEEMDMVSYTDQRLETSCADDPRAFRRLRNIGGTK